MVYIELIRYYKEKIITGKAELSEKLKDFERNGSHWLEPARQFILAAQQAKIIALQENPVTGRDFLKRIGSNRVLLSQKVAIEPKKSWQILYNLPRRQAGLPAEARSAEAEINANFSKLPDWLAWRDSFRIFDWNKALPVPELVLNQVKQLLALT